MHFAFVVCLLLPEMKMPKTYIIAGEQGEGKTTKLIDVVEKLKQKGCTIKGFFAEGYWSGNQRSGFDLVDIESGYSMEFCRGEPGKNYLQIGRFYFNPEAINYGENLLTGQKDRKTDLWVIDEIGPFELQGKLWANALTGLVRDSKNNLLITIRTTYIEEIIAKFNLTGAFICNVNDSDEKIVNQILKVSI